MRKSARIAGRGSVGTRDVQHGVWVCVQWGFFLVQYKLGFLSSTEGLSESAFFLEILPNFSDDGMNKTPTPALAMPCAISANCTEKNCGASHQFEFLSPYNALEQCF